MSAPLPSILHVDMDAFYASVEQRDNPELRGKPVIVGGINGRGVVCAASYEARPSGARSAMPVTQAKRLCPDAVFLPVRMKHYAQVSRQIREIFHSFTPLVEPLSLDEAFLDIHGCEKLFGDGPTIAQKIKTRVKREVGLNASVGVAPNKFLAKLASDICKPDGLLVLEPDHVATFLAQLPVSRLWGVGAKGEKRLHALGLRTVGQLAAWPEKALADHFGEFGRHLWLLANGIDHRRVVPDREAKSISTETTFSEDIADASILRIWLFDLVEHLARRLRQHGIWAQTIDLKIRSSDFVTRTRAKTLATPTNATNVIWRSAVDLFGRSLKPDLLPVRLLGVGAARLTRTPALQGDLFDGASEQRNVALDQAVDTIRAQFGASSIKRGVSLTQRESTKD